MMGTLVVKGLKNLINFELSELQLALAGCAANQYKKIIKDGKMTNLRKDSL